MTSHESIREASAYPVQLSISMPERYEPAQLFLRLLVCVAIGVLHQSLGTMFAALYVWLPTVAAILISRREGRGYIERDSGWVNNLLEWVVGFYAYMLFVTDRFPLEAPTRQVRLQIASRGEPTLSDALMRLLTSIPHALVLVVLAVIATGVSLVCALSVLINARVPEGLRVFQREFLGWLARFFAYHAALVDTYPPFTSPEVETRRHSGQSS